ncbi:hypothetical protein LMG26686_03020 [Achromobacter mucicolens]|uniref:hypothetical protein n=1 Tax=Achromobacter mucicolens TaxID=1389922 RepID=UPI001468DE0B|nr:hypothetical protein [Achromobacter mucicolens]CAB3872101.1 hypothetical protein LMG26686_03020 [Achromobacter mucicolens]
MTPPLDTTNIAASSQASNEAANNAASTRPIPAHYKLKAGDVDQELGKTIKDIVMCSESFIVYIDTDLYIQWHTTDAHDEVDYCGEVLNIVATLEAQSNFITDKDCLYSFRKRIGEGLARCLSGYPREISVTALDEVSTELRLRNKEVSWVWYFEAAHRLTLGLAVVFAALWMGRSSVRAELSEVAFDAILGAICGTFGALLSVTARSNRLTFDANAGKSLHVSEGLARIVAGAIGALVVALAFKAGMIFGGTTFSGNSLASLFFLCICAGFSERLVPSLIESTESAGTKNR